MKLHVTRFAIRLGTSLLVGIALVLVAGAGNAGQHTWDVNEVFSNADGSIQFVELWEANGTPGEVGVGNGEIASTLQGTYSWSNGAVASPTTNKYYLIATPGFAALPGAPTPDVIIPGGLVPFFDATGDTVTYWVYDSWGFGAVPTNGTDSLDRISGVGANTPTNYAGQTGSVNANAPIPLLSSGTTLLLMLALLAMMAFAVVRRRVHAT